MAVVHPALLSLILMALTLTSYHRYSSREQASSSVSEKSGDRNLTVYAMAVGQGDGNIILCPNSRDIVIVDMGAKPAYTFASYGLHLLEKRFNVNNETSIHIVVTHPHVDHFNFLQRSIKGHTLRLVKEIVLGGNFTEYPQSKSYSKAETYQFRDWIKDNGEILPVYVINNGSECFGNTDCKLTPVTSAAVEKDKKYIVARSDRWQFCGSDVNITVLGANVCKKSKNVRACTSHKNEKSVILKITYKHWSLFLSGDFEGIGQQQNLMKYWSSSGMLQSTYYKVAHHGAWTTTEKANMPELLKLIKPRRAYVSQAHPLVVPTYTHPRCEVIDNLINSVDKIDHWNYIACYRNTTRKRYGQIEHKLGYAIYETCRYYDYSSHCQICQDIEITTDGYSDYTVYRSVPDKYVKPSPTNCQKPLQ